MKQYRFALLCLVSVGLVWLAYLALGESIAKRLAAPYSARIMEATMGNVTNPAHFVQNRFRDALWLFTAGIGLFLTQFFVSKIFSNSERHRTRDLALRTLMLFAVVNVWLWFAAQTVLFWCLMWQGPTTHNLTRFHLKRTLFKENKASNKAVILGSSQARAQIDEELLNRLLEGRMHVAELHFPGSNGYDIQLIHRKITNLRPRWVICYVSELTFFSGQNLGTPANFFGLADCSDLGAKGMLTSVPGEAWGYGVLGNVLPAFYLRDVLSQRLLGSALTQISQQHNQTPRVDANAGARNHASNYSIDEKSEFQMNAFAGFISNCRARSENVLIFAGQTSPILARNFDPELRNKMLSSLRQLQEAYPNVVLIEDLPFQNEEDYEDSTHVNKSAQKRFTELAAELLNHHASRESDVATSKP